MVCSICKAEFSNGVALGGHVSKAHPGQSKKYNRKLLVRSAREEERKFLQEAKQLFIRHYDLDPLPDHLRAKVTKVKVLLMQGKAPSITDLEGKRRQNWDLRKALDSDSSDSWSLIKQSKLLTEMRFGRQIR